MIGMLDGKVALVTGGAAGIGLAIARTLHGQGATVVVADLDETAAKAAAGELGERASSVGCDVADEASVRAAFSAVTSEHGRLDVLVNNAGITRDASLKRMTAADFDAVIAVHLRGGWLCLREAYEVMKSQGSGSIINISSLSGKVGNPGQTNYSTAKAGLVGMTKAGAKELARYGVRVNAVQPGLIRTAMTEAMPQEAWDAKMAEIPMGRAGEPEEVANAVLFLASDLASYTTGNVLEVAGGRHM